MTLLNDRNDQIRRLARVLAYTQGAGCEFSDHNPLDDPKWVEDAEVYLDFIITGGKID